MNSNSESSNSECSECSTSQSSGQKKLPELTIINPVKFFNQRELCYYKKINQFFQNCYNNNPETLVYMIDIIEKKSNISLRVLDWFVTKYSKKMTNNKNCELFDVGISYKSQLKSYKKRYFDQFRRDPSKSGKKFYYPCTIEGYKLINGENKHIYTTLGQLNFFKWAFRKNIIFYVSTNLQQIIAEMNIYNKDEKKKKIQRKKEDVEKAINNTLEKIIEDNKDTDIMCRKENQFTLKFD